MEGRERELLYFAPVLAFERCQIIHKEENINVATISTKRSRNWHISQRRNEQMYNAIWNAVKLNHFQLQTDDAIHCNQIIL